MASLYTSYKLDALETNDSGVINTNSVIRRAVRREIFFKLTNAATSEQQNNKRCENKYSRAEQK